MESKDTNKPTAEFIERIMENQGAIHKVCNLYVNRHEDREDLKQEIILQLWKSYASFRGTSKFSTWMYRIAFNTAISNVRKSKTHPILEALSGVEPSVPAREAVDYLKDDVENLFKAISRLKDVEKAIVMLYLEEKSYKEIGEVVGVSEKNVSVRLVRMKDKLRKLIGGQ